MLLKYKYLQTALIKKCQTDGQVASHINLSWTKVIEMLSTQLFFTL